MTLSKQVISAKRRTGKNVTDLYKITLNNFCKKNKLFDNFNFKTCKLINNDSTINQVEYNQFKANARYGFIFIGVTGILPIPNSIYDVCKIEQEKKQRDAEKLLDQQEKSKMELERLYKLNNLDTEKKSDKQKHDNLLTEINNLEMMNGQLTLDDINGNDKSKSVEINKSQDRDNLNKTEVNAETDNELDETKVDAKTESETNKTNIKKNKHYRRFIKDLKDKFKIEKVDKYKYFETKLNSTEIIIEKPDVYKLIFNFTSETTFYVVIGDFQLKSQFIKTIDSNYKVDSALKEQYDFIEKIKEKEKDNIVEHNV